MRKSLVALAIAGALTGCAVNQPTAPQLDLPIPTVTAAEEASLERWWIAFDDPVLNQLQDEALAKNLDIKSALAAISLARSNVLLAQSPLYPSVNLNAGASRSKVTEVGSVPLFGFPATSNDYQIGLDLSYELDIWGKYRSGTLAARNTLAASRYSAEVVRITLASDVAKAYFQLRASDAELELLRRTLQSREETLGLQKDRFDGGVIGEYDLRQAEAERSAVVADILRVEQNNAKFEAALAALVGRSPREVFTPIVDRGVSIEDARIPSVPAGLPSGLLERRPDIKQSEFALAAAELRIFEARTDYFPAVSLTGAYGFESAALADLFSGPALVWRFGAALVQPLIGLKRIEASVDAATARRDSAIVDYQRTVQTAFREVHDALVVNKTSRDILTAETARRDQLAAALEVARIRYEAGRTSFLEVLDAQRTLLLAESLRLAAAREAKIAVVDVVKALGGGFNPDTVAEK